MTGALAIRDERHYLATVHEVRALAERCETVEDAKDLADRARAAQVWAQRAKLGEEKVALAAAAKLWAERRAGELLRELRGTAKRLPNRTVPAGNISRKDSHRWQKLAEIPAEEFAAAVEEQVPKGKVSYSAIEQRTKRKAREEGLRQQRQQATAEAKQSLRSASVVQADVRTWRPSDVAAIVTDPPYITDDAIDLYSALADFALDVLPEHGALVTMCWQPLLERVFAVMQRPALRFRWVIAWEFDSGENNSRTFDMARRVHDGWKPVLVYHKNGWSSNCPSIYDVIRSPGRVPLNEHVWEQGVTGVERLVRYASVPGDLICDPFVGSGTTGIAALKNDRDFIGCDVEPGIAAAAHARLAA